jgi:hypothetical protein
MMVLARAGMRNSVFSDFEKISQAVSDDLFPKEVDKQCWQDVWFIWVNRKCLLWYRGG